MKTNNKKIKILIISPESKQQEIWKFTNEWDRYFKVNIIFDTPNNIEKYLESKIDILFLWSDSFNKFKLEWYKIFKNNSEAFKYIAVSEKRKADDYKMRKALVDRIVYLDDEKNSRWDFISILRRFWKAHSRSSTIIHRNLILDFMEGNFIVGSEKIELTMKETKLLRLFTKRIGEYIPKAEIFKKVWGYDEDSTRSLDQMVFKLKKKIGSDYFHLSRNLGYRFE